MDNKYKNISIIDIDFDKDNPRIKKALEKYRDDIDAERIHFALKSADDRENAASSFNKLSNSIRASGGITQPITIYKKGNKYVCIDGNTRLAIYKDFNKKEGIRENWDNIIALVLDKPTSRQINSVRVSAHLVGARPWPAYEKACYLHYLYREEFKDFDEMVALCGGNKNDIERQIDAYEDMNEYYRDKVQDSEFHINRFSGFVELQKPSIKDSILSAGLSLDDFGNWIKDGKIMRLEDTRKLPMVLGDPKAREIFLKGRIGSIKKAIMHVEQRKYDASNTNIQNATLEQLTIATKDKLSKLTLPELQEFKTNSKETNSQISNLEDLYEMLENFLDNVRK